MKILLFVLEIAFIIWARKFIKFLTYRNSKESLVLQYEDCLKSEYEKYKPYLFDEQELKLTKPTGLQIPLKTDLFTNNTELRHTFMQVAYFIRLWHNQECTPINSEIEEIFYKIRRHAYSNGEDILNL